MKFNKLIVYLFLSTIAMSCSKKETDNTDNINNNFFNEIKAVQSDNFDLLIPDGFSYHILFQGGDTVVRKDGAYFPSKESNDMLAFVKDSNQENKAFLYVGHETFKKNPDLGDGGGATVLELVNNNNQWNVVNDKWHVDFSNVRETVRNCGGVLTPFGTVLTCEELEPFSNSELYYSGSGFQDTSDLNNGLKAYQNQGWVVEVDVMNKVAKHKIYDMGRFMHEDAHCLNDGKTVFLTDDNDPAVFFKFVAHTKGNYKSGQLYAFQQFEDVGNWIELPMDTLSLINIREKAIKLGATLFMRHEWMEEINGKLYIAETGKDEFDWSEYLSYTKPAKHFKLNEKGIGFDPYGRILEFNLKTNQMNVYIEGGTAKNDSLKNFSNPDCITKLIKENSTYLVICEDLIGFDKNRNHKQSLENHQKYCEVYMLNMSISNPEVDDLVRFAVVPNGAEATGCIFSTDYKSMFLNIQHPNSQNNTRFNKSSTVVIQGF